jgi:hypothetical protein
MLVIEFESNIVTFKSLDELIDKFYRGQITEDCVEALIIRIEQSELEFLCVLRSFLFFL